MGDFLSMVLLDVKTLSGFFLYNAPTSGFAAVAP